MHNGLLVHVVEADTAAPDSIRATLGRCGYACERYVSTREFLALIDERTRGCAVVEIDLTGDACERLQTAVGQLCPTLPVIIVARRGDMSGAARAIERGAAGVLAWPARPDELGERVAKALALDDSRRSDRLRRDAAEARLTVLTDREREVLRLVLAGHTTRQAAVILGISHRTVDVHRSRIKRKLKVNSLADLFRLGFASGQLDDTPADPLPIQALRRPESDPLTQRAMEHKQWPAA